METRESKPASVAATVTAAATAAPKLVKLPAHAKPGRVWVAKFLLGGRPQFVRDSISTAAVDLALAHEDETRRGEVRMNPR